MKKIVIYSSLTKNTKKVAKAIASELCCKAISFCEAKNLDEYDFIAVGYYIDKGDVDSKFKQFIKQNIKNKDVGLFITLGAEPSSEHSKSMLDNGRALLEQNGCKVVREFICQGRISQEIIEQMKQMSGITPERIARWEASKTHPDEKDLANARESFRGL